MGGAVTIQAYKKLGDTMIDGVILMAPMCKIADDQKPHPILTASLKN